MASYLDIANAGMLGWAVGAIVLFVLVQSLLFLTLAVLLNLAGDFPTALTIPLCVLASVGAARLMYRRGYIRERYSAQLALPLSLCAPQ